MFFSIRVETTYRFVSTARLYFRKKVLFDEMVPPSVAVLNVFGSERFAKIKSQLLGFSAMCDFPGRKNFNVFQNFVFKNVSS